MPRAPERPRRIVHLGDLIDRGPEPLRCLRLADDANGRADRATILCGNHEGIMLEALCNERERGAFELWMMLGGTAALSELGIEDLPRDEQRRRIQDALPDGLEDRLWRAPSHVKDGDLRLVYAGIPPLGDRTEFLAQAVDEFSCPSGHWSTIRGPFLHWREGWDDLGEPGPTVVVHGHSSATHRLVADAEELARLADLTRSHGRINLDLDSSSSGQVAALEAIAGRFRLHLARQA